ncbi:MAG: hypothetical protein ACT4QF_20705 [Sporichthyaceae bacterium]
MDPATARRHAQLQQKWAKQEAIRAEQAAVGELRRERRAAMSPRRRKLDDRFQTAKAVVIGVLVLGFLGLCVAGLIDSARNDSPPSARDLCYANQSWNQTWANDQCADR